MDLEVCFSVFLIILLKYVNDIKRIFPLSLEIQSIDLKVDYELLYDNQRLLLLLPITFYFLENFHCKQNIKYCPMWDKKPKRETSLTPYPNIFLV